MLKILELKLVRNYLQKVHRREHAQVPHTFLGTDVWRGEVSITGELLIAEVLDVKDIIFVQGFYYSLIVNFEAVT